MTNNNLIFEFLNSINENKIDIMTPDNEKLYQPYLINHFLSGTLDTVFLANEMNRAPHLDKKMQYDFLRMTVRKKRRRTKWLKPSYIENLENVQRYFKYNITRAKEALNILTPEQLEQIKRFLDIGGTK